MTAFASWLVGIITQLATVLGLSLTRRVAIISAAVSAVITLTITLGVFISSLISTIAYALPAWAVPGAYLLPSNLSYCISSYFAAKVARFIYDWNMDNIKIASSVS